MEVKSNIINDLEVEWYGLKSDELIKPSFSKLINELLVRLIKFINPIEIILNKQPRKVSIIKT